MDAPAKARPVNWGSRIGVAGSQTSKNSSLAPEDESALPGLEGIAVFCFTLELTAFDQVGRNG